ncbi:UNVERIFIED_CONTAM: hypothetical protein FKN15_026790, partial [Acipenser sinensis]
ICLGAEAADEFHTVEIEGLNYEGTMIKVQLAVLKPSVIPTISLGGFEITPPVTFRLKSGSGPVFISGQHFISAKEEEDDGEEEEEEEEENNTSPVKRLSNSPSNSLPVSKKLKFDKEVEDEDNEEEDDEDEDDEEHDDDDEEEEKEEKEKGSPPKTPQKTPCEKKEKSGATTSLSVNEAKDKLKTMVSKGHALPKSQMKFANFAKYTYKIVDQKVAEELWNYLQKLKAEKK